MPTFDIIEDAAAQAAGTNLMEGHRAQTSSVPRRIRRIGIGGSAAVGDCAFDIFYGSLWMGTLYNSVAGAGVVPKADGDLVWLDQKKIIPAGQPLNIIVVDPSATNPAIIRIECEELPPSRLR